MEFPILYHQGHGGKLYSWQICTVGAEILCAYGTVEGEKSVTSKIVKGKNIGKKNETTPEQQAESEARSMWQKKKDTKYSETIEESKETVFLPMLAQDLRKRNLVKKPLVYPLDVQPKLDGNRAMAFWDGNKVKLMSRGGLEWIVPHVSEALEKVMPKDYVADGEIYIHGVALQDIGHLIDHPELPEHKDLGFYIFDGFNKNIPLENQPWGGRYFDYQVIFNNVEHPLYLVDAVRCLSDEELYKFLNGYEEQGYEGIIIRILDGIYELGYRSRNLWKLKNFIDGEFPIVGFHEATGNDKGTVIWDCKLPNGGTVGVRPKGTRAQRTKWFQEGHKHIGRMFKIKFHKYTNDGSLEFPVGVCFRDKKDM